MTARAKHLVLAVDDEPDILTLNRMILEQAGFEVVTAGDGVDAIQKAVDFSPDLILLDVMMPFQDGLQKLEFLKERETSSSIPVVLMSSTPPQELERLSRSSGAQGFIVKPIEKSVLLAAMSKHLQ